MASQNSRTVDVAAGQNLAQLDNSALQLDGGTTGINGVTIINNSPLSVHVFRGSQQPSGQGMAIAPYQYMAIPASNVKYVALQYAGNAIVAGSIDIQWTSDLVVALASSLITQLSSQYPNGATPFSGTASVDWISGVAIPVRFYTNTNGPIIGRSVYITDIVVHGVDRQDLSWYCQVIDGDGSTVLAQPFTSNSGENLDYHTALPTPSAASTAGPNSPSVIFAPQASTDIIGVLFVDCSVNGYYL